MLKRLRNTFDTRMTRLSDRYSQHKRWMAPAFFVLGFLFDAIALQRVDEFFGLLQQAVYLLLAAGLISLELIEHERELKAPKFLARVWPYREFVLQFIFGTLLNIYTIFYFKSSSALASFVFILVMGILLVLHEFRKFGRYQTHLHIGILSLCLISYCGLLAPILMGFLGPLPFFVANFVAWLLVVAYRRWLEQVIDIRFEILKKTVTYPFAIVQIGFVLLYIFRVLPPVPLSVSYMGIFHAVEKRAGEYVLTYNRPAEYFWQHGDQTFFAKPGDTVHCFVRIFAPTRFKDELKVRWLFKDSKTGWVSSDAIPLAIVGGREEGYRALTRKSNYQPGDWRVQVETADGREVGRISLTIVPEEELTPRIDKTILQ